MFTSNNSIEQTTSDRFCLYISVHSEVTFYVTKNMIRSVRYENSFIYQDNEHDIIIYISDQRYSADDEINVAFDGKKLFLFENFELCLTPLAILLSYVMQALTTLPSVEMFSNLESSIFVDRHDAAMQQLFGAPHFWEYEPFYVMRGSDGPIPIGVAADLIVEMSVAYRDTTSIIIAMASRPFVNFNNDLWSLVATAAIVHSFREYKQPTLPNFYVKFDKLMARMRRRLSAMYKLGCDFRPFWRRDMRRITNLYDQTLPPEIFVVDNPPRGEPYFRTKHIEQVGIADSQVALLELINWQGSIPTLHHEVSSQTRAQKAASRKSP